MLEKYPQDVKVVHKNFPLRNHKFAMNAAKAALAAHRQGRFWDYHHKLFENYKKLNDTKFQALATDLGLDLERFNKDMNDPSIQRLIYRDLKEGRNAGIRGIPAVFINGKLLKNTSGPVFQRMIDAELKKRKPR
ncbi:MAG: thioredoxin domain-containing protein [Deltaproteobacteria bacterium]|nr:MAG: thioredoxin domain-containing protein [Deltaproteobacteria bacterium]